MSTITPSISSDGIPVKLNNLQSSLKFFNFEGMTKDQIIDKYEETTCQREKQIRDIAYEIGIINEKLCNTNDRIKSLEEENSMLHNKLLKKDTILDQELTNKDIMFIKLNNLQNENDKLKNILKDNGISMTLATNGKDKKSFFSGIVDKFTGKDNTTGNSKKLAEVRSIQLEDNTTKTASKTASRTESNKTTGNMISASITPDLLNSIDLNKVQFNTSNSNGNTKPTQKASSKYSLSSSKLASQNVDYEPVFK